MKGFWIVVTLLALMWIGGRADQEREVEFAPTPAPAAALEPVDMGPTVPTIPLAISETTTPPGWNPPDTPEEQIVALWQDNRSWLIYQAVMVAVLALVVLGLVVAMEAVRRRGES